MISPRLQNVPENILKKQLVFYFNLPDLRGKKSVTFIKTLLRNSRCESERNNIICTYNGIDKIGNAMRLAFALGNMWSSFCGNISHVKFIRSKTFTLKSQSQKTANLLFPIIFFFYPGDYVFEIITFSYITRDVECCLNLTDHFNRSLAGLL